LLNGLFFAAAFGMLVSACCRHERRALSLAVVGVLGLSALLPLAGWGLEVWRQSAGIHPLFLLGSPATTFLAAAQPILGGGNFDFGASLLCTHLLGWLFLVSASVVLPATVRDRAVRIGVRPKALGSRGHGTTAPATSDSVDPPLHAGDRPGQRGLGVWPVLVVFALTWLGGWAVARQHWFTLPVFGGTAVVLHACLCYFVTLHACRAPNEDQRTGVLELLLTTPLGDDAYLTGRMLSLKRQCVGPLLCVLAADVALLVAAWWDSGMLSWECLEWLAAFVFLVGRLLVDLYTLAWVGFWQALKTGDTGRAIRRTFFYVFIVRWIAPVAVLAVLGMVTQGRSFQTPATPILAAVGYVLMPLVSVQFLAQARSELQDDLRPLALGHAMAEWGPSWSPLIGLPRVTRPKVRRYAS
jgi:hypothetical protein